VPNRTTDVYVGEKSDCAVAPVNRSNKKERSYAEAGEGRAQTKENIAPAGTNGSVKRFV
jgi:hypothetical protein